jgi:hypothetical protein
MLPVRKSGGPGKEVPPERARTNQRKRNGSLAAECLRKTRRPASRKWNASACRCREAMPMPPCAAGEYEKAEIYRGRPIDRQKAQATKTVVREVMMPTKLLRIAHASWREETERGNGSKLELAAAAYRRASLIGR